MSDFSEKSSVIISKFRANQQKIRDDAAAAQEVRRAFLVEFNGKVNGTIERLVRELRENIGTDTDISVEPNGDAEGGSWLEVTITATTEKGERKESLRIVANPDNKSFAIQETQSGRLVAVNGSSPLDLFQSNILESQLLGMLGRLTQ